MSQVTSLVSNKFLSDGTVQQVSRNFFLYMVPDRVVKTCHEVVLHINI